MREPDDTVALSEAARHYIDDLRPRHRTLAREWAETDGDEFKARIGVAVDKMANGRRMLISLAIAAGIVGGGVGGTVAELLRGLPFFGV